MKCPNCKSEIPADSKFCPDCGTEIKKNSSDIISTFLSLGGITLGKSNIYDVESSEYIKANESEFGDYKVIKAKTEDGIECVASAKDKIVFAFIIRDVSSIELPESWKKLKIDEDNLSLSMERVLGKNGFEWEDFENGGTSRGFAFKKANEEKYLTFVIEKDDALAIAMLDDEQKSSLYANLQADNDIDDELEEEVEEEELPCCPNCGSYDVDDDYSDYLQYTCNKCGHNWGHDDTVECPECGSNDVENDGTDYQQYTCNDCGHVWGDDEDEYSGVKPDTLDFTVGGVRFKMIRVEHGEFMMGATKEQENPSDNEKPAHKVTLTEDYYIGETQVTQALWKAVMGLDAKGAICKNYEFPRDFTSWNQWQEFIKKLNARTGKKFRMPTEAEWEFAARGGNASCGYQYSGGNYIDNVAWYEGNSDGEYKYIHPVKELEPNELGIYDMSGNVWEWCQDWYGDYKGGSQTNPTGPTSGSNRVIRGGCSCWDANYCRSSFRVGANPDNEIHFFGLRLVLSE